MSNQDEYTDLQQDIRKLYHQADLPEPSAELDKAILQQAENAITKKSDNATETKNVISLNVWRKYRWPLSSAASVLLVATLVFLQPSIYETQISSEPKLMSAPQPTNEPQMMGEMTEPSLMNEQMTTADIEEQESGSPALDIQDEPHAIQQVAPKSAPNVMRVEQGLSQVEAKLDLIDLDSPETAITKIKALIKNDDLMTATRYFNEANQHFPELSMPNHPRYQEWLELSKQLSTQ